MKIRSSLVCSVLLLLSFTGVSHAQDDCDSNDTIVTSIPVINGLSYSCGADGTTFSINETVLLAGYDLGAVSLTFVDANRNPITSDAKCTESTSTNGEFSFNLDDYYGQCASQIQSQGNKQHRVSYILCVKPLSFGVISRKEVVYFYFNCIYDAKINKTLGPIQPSITAKLFEKDPPDEAIAAWIAINRFTDSNFTDEDNSTTACDGESVYLEMVLDADPNFNLTLNGIDCLVSPSSNATAASHVDLIEDGCPLPDPLAGGSPVIYENFESKRFQFSFTSFHWTFPFALDDQELHVICIVNVCNQDAPDNCVPKPNCTGSEAPIRRKRRAHGMKPRGPNEHLVAFGPIKITKRSTASKKRTCDKAAMLECSYTCAVLSDGSETCTCPPGYMLGFDQRSCSKYPSKSESSKAGRSDFLRLLNNAVSIVIMVFSVAALVTNCLNKKKLSFKNVEK